MSNYAQLIAQSSATPLTRPPHQPGTVVDLSHGAEVETLLSAEELTSYQGMQITKGGRRAETIWLHEAPGETEVGAISWFDIYRIKPIIKKAPKGGKPFISLYLRNGDRCIMEGWNLGELMARLTEKRVLQVWAFDGNLWPEPPQSACVVTSIKYLTAE